MADRPASALSSDGVALAPSTAPNPGLPPDAAAAPLASAAGPQLPATLMAVAADDFLPEPGPWTRGLSRQLLALLTLGAAGLALWPMHETVQAEGLVRPQGENTLIQSERGGSLIAVQLRPNQAVQPGQVLARFDNQALEAERRQLQQELSTLALQSDKARDEQLALQKQAASLEAMTSSLTASSRQAVDQARTRLALERREVERYRQLLDSGAVPRSLVDQQEARRIVSASEVIRALQGVSEQQARGATELARLRQSASQASSAADELQKQIVQRRTRLQEVERHLAQGTVRSPIRGSVVSTALRHPGQVVEPGAVMAVLAPDDGRLRVQARVPSESISQLRVGQEASLRLAACPFSEFGVMPARVTGVAADVQPEAAPSARGDAAAAGYGLELAPQRSALRSAQGRCALKPGMEVRADVVTRRTTVLMFLINKLRLGH